MAVKLFLGGLKTGYFFNANNGGDKRINKGNKGCLESKEDCSITPVLQRKGTERSNGGREKNGGIG